MPLTGGWEPGAALSPCVRQAPARSRPLAKDDIPTSLTAEREKKKKQKNYITSELIKNWKVRSGFSHFCHSQRASNTIMCVRTHRCHVTTAVLPDFYSPGVPVQFRLLLCRLIDLNKSIFKMRRPHSAPSLLKMRSYLQYCHCYETRLGPTAASATLNSP